MGLLYEEDDDEDKDQELKGGSAPAFDLDAHLANPQHSDAFDLDAHLGPSHESAQSKQQIGGWVGPTWESVENFGSAVRKPLDVLGQALSLPKQATEWASKKAFDTTPAEVIQGLMSGQTAANVMGVGDQFKQQRATTMQEHPYLGKIAEGFSERGSNALADPAMALVGGPAILARGMQALLGLGAFDQSKRFAEVVQRDGFTPEAAKILAEAGVDATLLGATHKLGEKMSAPEAAPQVEAPRPTEMQPPPLEVIDLEGELSPKEVNERSAAAEKAFQDRIKYQQKLERAQAGEEIADQDFADQTKLRDQILKAQAAEDLASRQGGIEQYAEQQGRGVEDPNTVADMILQSAKEADSLVMNEPPIELPPDTIAPRSGLLEAAQDFVKANDGVVDPHMLMRQFKIRRATADQLMEQMGMGAEGLETGSPHHTSAGPDSPAVQQAKDLFHGFMGEAEGHMGELWGPIAEGAVRTQFDPAGVPLPNNVAENVPVRGRVSVPGGEGVEGRVSFNPLTLVRTIERSNIPRSRRAEAFAGWLRESANHELSHTTVEASHRPGGEFDSIYDRMKEHLESKPSPLLEGMLSEGGAPRVKHLYDSLVAELSMKPPPGMEGAGAEGMSINDLPPAAKAEGAEAPPPSNKTDWLEKMNVPRALITGIDLSGLRQAAPQAARHPILAFKALIEGAKAMKSDKMFIELEDGVRATPDFQLGKAAGVFEGSVGTRLNSEQIYYGNRAIENVFKRMGLEKYNPWAASERGFTLMLNKLRFDTFNARMDQLRGMGLEIPEGYNPETHGELAPEVMEAIKHEARLVNNATGRGTYPGEGTPTDAKTTFDKTMQSASNAANAILFSPRMILSRANLLKAPTEWVADYQRFQKAGLDPAQAAKATMTGSALTMGSYLAYVAGTLTLLNQAFGAKTETDPRSSDFGKARWGNTRIDLTSGFGPMIKMAAQMATGERKTKYGKVQEINRAEPLAQFGRAKLAPVPGLAMTALTGKDVAGQDFGWKHIEQMFMPMSINDLREIGKEDGLLATALAFPFVMTGLAGVQVHEAPSKYASPKAQEEFYRLGVAPPGKPRPSVRLGTGPSGEQINYKMDKSSIAALREETEPIMYKTIDDLVNSPEFQAKSPRIQKLVLQGMVKSMGSMQRERARKFVPPGAAAQTMQDSLDIDQQ